MVCLGSFPIKLRSELRDGETGLQRTIAIGAGLFIKMGWSYADRGGAVTAGGGAASVLPGPYPRQWREEGPRKSVRQVMGILSVPSAGSAGWPVLT